MPEAAWPFSVFYCSREDQAYPLCNPVIAGDVRDLGALQLDHQAGPGPGAANQHAARVRLVQRILEVFDLALDQRAHAGLADTRAATVVRVQAVALGKIQTLTDLIRMDGSCAATSAPVSALSDFSKAAG